MPAPFRYRRIGYVALNVTDVGRSAHYLETMLGLERFGALYDQGTFFRCGSDHHSVMLYRGATPGLKRVGWQVDDEDNLDKAFDHFSKIALGPIWIEDEEARQLGLRRAFRVREPTTGTQFEYYAAMVHISRPVRQDLVNIQGLGHVVIRSPDCRKSVEFATREMGFRVSDYIGREQTLLRCWPNRAHHSWGYGRSASGEPRHHHVSFMVESMDDVGQLYWRARKTGTKIVFGPGRHPASGSVCLYVLDPDDMIWEYSLGMEEFPEVDAREPRLMSSDPEINDHWGAVMEKDFFDPAGAIEQAAS